MPAAAVNRLWMTGMAAVVRLLGPPQAAHPTKKNLEDKFNASS
jgi:hypothetical protein